MKIFINKEEIKAISKAWDNINEKLEGCDGDENEEAELQSILRGLRSLETKIRKNERK